MQNQTKQEAKKQAQDKREAIKQKHNKRDLPALPTINK